MDRVLSVNVCMGSMRFVLIFFVVALLVGIAAAEAGEVTVVIYRLLPAGGGPIGVITAMDTEQGLRLIPKLKLPQGPHRFALHLRPNCGRRNIGGMPMPGLGAGGHLTELPTLEAGPDGRVTKAMTVPGLSVANLEHRALIVYAGSRIDPRQAKAMSDEGVRIACGIVTSKDLTLRTDEAGRLTAERLEDQSISTNTHRRELVTDL